jgi:uncharacterized protein DUF6868
VFRNAQGWDRKMSIELTRHVLLWSTIINYGILLVWFSVFVLAHAWMRHLHGKWFRLSDEQFDALHYAGMSMYKIGILLFNLVPFLALTILG